MTVKELARAPNSKLSFPYISAKETKHMELKVQSLVPCRSVFQRHDQKKNQSFSGWLVSYNISILRHRIEYFTYDNSLLYILIPKKAFFLGGGALDQTCGVQRYGCFLLRVQLDELNQILDNLPELWLWREANQSINKNNELALGLVKNFKKPPKQNKK